MLEQAHWTGTWPPLPLVRCSLWMGDLSQATVYAMKRMDACMQMDMDYNMGYGMNMVLWYYGIMRAWSLMSSKMVMCSWCPEGNQEHLGEEDLEGGVPEHRPWEGAQGTSGVLCP